MGRWPDMGSGREPGVLDGQGWITLWSLSHRCSSATGQPGSLGQVAEPGYTSAFPTKLGSLHPCFGVVRIKWDDALKGRCTACNGVSFHKRQLRASAERD